MPRYMILLRDDIEMMSRPPDEQEAVFRSFVAWSEALFRNGQHAGVERLDRARAIVRLEGGKPVIDGPYAEGKEAVMGFFVVEAESLEAAAQIALGVPSVALGAAVEVRPIAPFPKPGHP
jgi:hypothetical protein